MYNIDELDSKIIKLLEEDAWQTSAALAKPLNVSSATVRRRLKQLTRNEVIRAVAVIQPDKVAARLNAVIALNVSHQSLNKVMKILANQPEVKWVAGTTGRFDVLALVEFESTEELSNFIQVELTQIEGIKDSETFICLHIDKRKQLPSLF